MDRFNDDLTDDTATEQPSPGIEAELDEEGDAVLAILREELRDHWLIGRTSWRESDRYVQWEERGPEERLPVSWRWGVPVPADLADDVSDVDPFQALRVIAVRGLDTLDDPEQALLTSSWSRREDLVWPPGTALAAYELRDESDEGNVPELWFAPADQAVTVGGLVAVDYDDDDTWVVKLLLTPRTPLPAGTRTSATSASRLRPAPAAPVSPARSAGSGRRG